MAWYHDAVFHEVYVRGFYDSNGDGQGDIAGLTAILRAHDFSHATQPFEVDLERWKDRTPAEMLGDAPRASQPYFLSRGPHGSAWHRLERNRS